MTTGVSAMDSEMRFPVAARGRALLLSLLASAIWIVLSIFGAGSSAVADDSDSPGALLGPVTESVSKVVPVPALTEPTKAVVERVTDQASQLAEQSQLREHTAPVVEQVAPDAAANVAHKAVGTVTKTV